MKLNEKIYYCRKKLALSQDALAEKIGVSRQAISKWETGATQPELDKLAALARVFDVTADWLLSEDEPEGYESPAAEEPPQTSVPPRPAYPAWVDDLPGFFGRTLKRYGWIYGVYLAVVGGLFTGLGALGRYIAGQMMSAAGTLMGSMSPFGSPMGGTSFGAPTYVPGLGEVYIESSDLTELYGVTVSGMTQNNPVSLVCGFIMGLGIVMIVGGVILAVLLKRYGDSEN